MRKSDFPLLNVFREIISKQNAVMLLMMNKLLHHVDDHIHFLQVQAMQNNIKVIVSECHLKVVSATFLLVCF